MNKIAINTFMFPERNIDDILKTINSNLIKGIGLYQGHLNDDNDILVNKKFNELIKISLYVVFVDISTSNFSNQKIEDYFFICNKLGIERITIIPQANRSTSESVWMDNFIKLTEYLIKLIEKYSVRILFEPIHPSFRDISCLCSFDKAIILNNYIDSNYFKWIIDFYHLESDEQLYNLPTKFVSNIHTVHLSDFHKCDTERLRGFLGEGDMPLEKMIYELKNKCYSNWWEFEVLDSKVELTNAIKKIENNIETYLI